MQNEFNLYCDDDFIGTFCAKEVAEKLNVTEDEVLDISLNGQNYKNYRIVKIYKQKPNYDKKTLALMEEWDRVTARYRHGC